MGKNKKKQKVSAKPTKRHEFTLSLVIRDDDTVITKAIRGYIDEDMKHPAADSNQFGIAVGQIIAAAAPAVIPRNLVNGSVAQAIAAVAADYLQGVEG